MRLRSKRKRFSANPVEIVILLTVTVAFCVSVYNLLYDKDQFEVSSLEGTKTSSRAGESEADRSIAAATPSFFAFTLDCDQNPEQKTRAPRARLTIPLCKPESKDSKRLLRGGDVKMITKPSIVNNATKLPAIVFMDSNPLTTDFIQLNSGKNPLHIEYGYRDGEKVIQEIVITRE